MRHALSLAVGVGLGLLAVACGGDSSAVGPGSDGGGADGGCGPPPPEHCATGCNGGTVSAECIDGSWTCPPLPAIACFFDAGTLSNDAGTVASDAGIDCMGLTCNAATQYCDIRGGGAQLPDAGSNLSVACPTLPAMPCDAGTGCACIPNACSCTDDGGAIKNVCEYP